MPDSLRDRVAKLLCSSAAIQYPCPGCLKKADSILDLVAEDRRALVGSLSFLRAMGYCTETGCVGCRKVDELLKDAALKAAGEERE